MWVFPIFFSLPLYHPPTLAFLFIFKKEGEMGETSCHKKVSLQQHLSLLSLNCCDAELFTSTQWSLLFLGDSDIA